ncbi:MAG TPA: xanthine dehydrogenase family protein subunit M [Gaiellaceae bacterium]|nr:xanthine dehydrogenase family protein subunit M [Gaiellaceae bacterium]
MIPAEFGYEVAESIDHAIALLGEKEDAKLLAGGHSLLPAMKLRLARPSFLIDVGRLGDLSYVRDEGDTIAIGALTRHKDVASSPLLREHCPLLAHVAGQVGDPQVRHRGTIGGSLAHGDPASDLPTAILALRSQLVVRGPSGDRAIPAGEFFTGVFQTALEPSEVLVEIRAPKLQGAGWSYTKMSRRAQDWATVAVAAVVKGNGAAAPASIALTNMGATTLEASAVERALGDGASIVEAAALAAEGTDPPSDHAASAEFRRHLARVLTRRALEEATTR